MQEHSAPKSRRPGTETHNYKNSEIQTRVKILGCAPSMDSRIGYGSSRRDSSMDALEGGVCRHQIAGYVSLSLSLATTRLWNAVTHCNLPTSAVASSETDFFFFAPIVVVATWVFAYMFHAQQLIPRYDMMRQINKALTKKRLTCTVFIFMYGAGKR